MKIVLGSDHAGFELKEKSSCTSGPRDMRCWTLDVMTQALLIILT